MRNRMRYTPVLHLNVMYQVYHLPQVGRLRNDCPYMLCSYPTPLAYDLAPFTST